MARNRIVQAVRLTSRIEVSPGALAVLVIKLVPVEGEAVFARRRGQLLHPALDLERASPVLLHLHVTVGVGRRVRWVPFELADSVSVGVKKRVWLRSRLFVIKLILSGDTCCEKCSYESSFGNHFNNYKSGRIAAANILVDF